MSIVWIWKNMENVMQKKPDHIGYSKQSTSNQQNIVEFFIINLFVCHKNWKLLSVHKISTYSKHKAQHITFHNSKNEHYLLYFRLPSIKREKNDKQKDTENSQNRPNLINF